MQLSVRNHSSNSFIVGKVLNEWHEITQRVSPYIFLPQLHDCWWFGLRIQLYMHAKSPQNGL